MSLLLHKKAILEKEIIGINKRITSMEAAQESQRENVELQILRQQQMIANKQAELEVVAAQIQAEIDAQNNPQPEPQSEPQE